MTNKFKVGDRVRVVNKSLAMGYDNGDVGIVEAVSSAEGWLEVRFDHMLDYLRTIYPTEVELVREGINDTYRDENGYTYRFTDTACHVTSPEQQQAKRYNENKAPLSYILLWPKAIEALANVCRKGEEKYEKFNYKKGAPISQYMDSGLRHQKAFVNGEDLDTETQCHHLAMDIWNKLQALEVMLTPEMKEKFDDRYKP